MPPIWFGVVKAAAVVLVEAGIIMVWSALAQAEADEVFNWSAVAVVVTAGAAMLRFAFREMRTESPRSEAQWARKDRDLDDCERSLRECREARDADQQRWQAERDDERARRETLLAEHARWRAMAWSGRRYWEAAHPGGGPPPWWDPGLD